jgi:exopolysaccharide biosynthesis polyprenyl glycosylphosphotransferase
LPVATLVWLVSFSFAHLYEQNEKIWSWRVARRMTKASFLAVALFVSTLFFFRGLTIYPLARWMIPISMLTVPTLVSLGRYALHWRLVLSARLSGRGLARALVLGVGPGAKEIARSIRRHPEFGWTIVGFLSVSREDIGQLRTGLEVIGTVDELPEILKREKIEAVFVTQPDFRRELLGDVFVECQKQMVDVKVVPDYTEMLFSQLNIEEVDGIPFLGLKETPLRGWNVVVKRLFDLAASSALILLAAPLMAVIAWLIRRDSKGPVFYRQARIGADGRRFVITKFRTMTTDAEKHTGPVFATPDDPRQTRVGRRLRQTHLDELPQLFSVVTGAMSIVGPRPERPFFVERFREEIPRYMARHRIKSGMTGWAQVNGQTGSEGTISERLRYDLYYIENWSLLFDLKILLLTLVWLIRRAKQMFTLPADHPVLRRSEDTYSDQREQPGGGEPSRTTEMLPAGPVKGK